MLAQTIGKLWRVCPPQVRRWLTRRVHTTFTISAAGIITNEAGEVLLLDHILRSTVSGWGLPGGFIGLREQPQDGLRREIFEETGLELQNVRIFSCRTVHRHVEIIMTAKAVGEASVRSREITRLGWFSADGLPQEMNRCEKELIRTALGQRP